MAKDELEELSGLVAQTAELEAANQESWGKQYNYLKILGNSGNDPIMLKGKPEYIEGAMPGMFVIAAKKVLLGESTDVTVLGMFKLYEDSIPGEQTEQQKKMGQDAMRKTVGFWMPSDAEQVEDTSGLFDRTFIDKNGTEHLLSPVHWVFFRLEKFPELEDVLYTFRGKSNKVYKELQKLISQSGAKTCTELRLRMGIQEMLAKGYEKNYMYPAFTVAGRNYGINGDNKIELVDGGLDKASLAEVIKTSHAMQKEYADYKMVPRKGNLAALVQGLSSSAPRHLEPPVRNVTPPVISAPAANAVAQPKKGSAEF